MSKYGYSFIDYKSPVPVPERLPNGGLYVGKEASGTWGNVPVEPEAHILTTKNLLSANPPPGATKQTASTPRPGNNHVELPFHTSVPNLTGFYIRD